MVFRCWVLLLLFFWGGVVFGTYQELVDDLGSLHQVQTRFPGVDLYDVLIEARTFTYLFVDSVFSGNEQVRVLYDELELTSDSFTFDIQKEEIRVYDDVLFSFKQFRSNSNKALYNISDRMITLLGEVSLMYGEDFVKGEHVVIDLDMEKVSSKGRSRIKLSTETKQP